MLNVTPKTRREIESLFAKSRFTKHAFQIKEDATGEYDSPNTKDFFFGVSFVHDGSYYIDIWHITNQVYASEPYQTFLIAGAPGERYITFQEELEGNPWLSLLESIGDWVKRVDDNTYLVNDATAHIESIKQQLEERLRNNPESMSAQFTAAEIVAFVNHLNKVEADYLALKAKHGVKEEEAEKLQETIDNLRAELHYLTRGTWLRQYTYQMLDVAEGLTHSRAVRALLFEATKTAVSEGVKGLLHSAG